eukprot:12424873-Alexandrium_andersonii.AAC.1
MRVGDLTLVGPPRRPGIVPPAMQRAPCFVAFRGEWLESSATTVLGEGRQEPHALPGWAQHWKP